ncbi:Protein salt-induced and EIN3/EIL1-dependent 1, partial [Cucurbita argyrosperma subsp. sororia]
MPLQSQEFTNSPLFFLKITFSITDNLKMNRRNSREGGAPKLELKLNLSPPRGGGNRGVESPNRSATVSPTSPPSSCVSSEAARSYSNSPETATMMLVGCPRCLMYVMLSEQDPKCPKCKSTVLLDVLHDNTAVKTRQS